MIPPPATGCSTARRRQPQFPSRRPISRLGERADAVPIESRNRRRWIRRRLDDEHKTQGRHDAGWHGAPPNEEVMSMDRPSRLVAGWTLTMALGALASVS